MLAFVLLGGGGGANGGGGPARVRSIASPDSVMLATTTAGTIAPAKLQAASGKVAAAAELGNKLRSSRGNTPLTVTLVPPLRGPEAGERAVCSGSSYSVKMRGEGANVAPSGATERESSKAESCSASPLGRNDTAGSKRGEKHSTAARPSVARPSSMLGSPTGK